MTILASSGLAAALPLLFLVACPLMMIFMMRGMHGGRREGDGHGPTLPKPREQMSMDELKHARDELNEEIGQRAEHGAYARDRRSAALR